MAGGTGSGLGAFITQNLQDQYSDSLKMNHIIWPYGTGEVWTYWKFCIVFFAAEINVVNRLTLQLSLEMLTASEMITRYGIFMNNSFNFA